MTKTIGGKMLIGWIIIDTDCQAWVRQQLVSPGHRCEERLTAAGLQKQKCGTVDSQVKTSHICLLCPVVISLSKLIARWLNMCY